MNKDIAPRSCENGGGNGGGGGAKWGPPSIQTSVKNLVTFRSYFFLNFQQISFKLSNFTNFKADVPYLVHVKSLKKTLEGSIMWEGESR